MTILYALCFFCILKGTIQYYYFQNKSKKYYKTEGTIVDNYKDETYSLYTGSYRHYYPVVEYTDKNGETVRIRSEDYNPDIPMYEVGSKVPLLVNPDDNSRLLFDEEADKSTIPMVWIGIGIIGLLVCCFYIKNLPF